MMIGLYIPEYPAGEPGVVDIADSRLPRERAEARTASLGLAQNGHEVLPGPGSRNVIAQSRFKAHLPIKKSGKYKEG